MLWLAECVQFHETGNVRQKEQHGGGWGGGGKRVKMFWF